MSERGKLVAVVIDTSEPARVREGLRAAVGLSLRGARVRVLIGARTETDEPGANKALATLRALGHEIRGGALRDDLRDGLRGADVVEVWS